MIYRMHITVTPDINTPAVEHEPILIRTMTDGVVLEQTEAEQEMVAEAFKAQVLDLIKLMSPVKR